MPSREMTMLANVADEAFNINVEFFKELIAAMEKPGLDLVTHGIRLKKKQGIRFEQIEKKKQYDVGDSSIILSCQIQCRVSACYRKAC